MDTVSIRTAALRRLKASQKWQDLVLAGKIGTDASDEVLDAEKLDKAWLFQIEADNEPRPYRDPEGSGTSAVVIAQNMEWGVNSHNTGYFPRLQIFAYSDDTRDDGGAPITRDAQDKAQEILRVLDESFHILKTEADHNWPGLYVFSCRRTSVQFMSVPQTEGNVVRLAVEYEAATG